MSRENSYDYSIEVIGAGLGRTGTSTLKKALEILGYNKCYHMEELIINNHVNFWNEILTINKMNCNDVIDFSKVYNNGKSPKYQATMDMPSSLIYDKILLRYPTAKVILTVRDPESWYSSSVNTIFMTDVESPHTLFGLKVMAYIGMPQRNFGKLVSKIFRVFLNGNDWSKDNVIYSFQNHNKRVIDTIPSDKLLIFHVSQGWEPLCNFLGKAKPKEAFPHLNDYNHMRMVITIYNIIGYLVFIFIISLPVVIAVIVKRLITI